MNLTVELLYMSYSNNVFNSLPLFWDELLKAGLFLLNMLRWLLKIESSSGTSRFLVDPLININGRTLKSDMFIKAGLILVKDLIYETVPGFLPAKGICEIILEVFPEADSSRIQTMYSLIKSCIPREWNNLGHCDTPCADAEIALRIEGKYIQVKSMTTKDFYCYLRRGVEKPCVSLNNWSVRFHNVDFKPFWRLPSLTVKSPECRELDYKVIHNAIFTKEKLFKIGKVDNALCEMCNSTPEDLFHMFIGCTSLSGFSTYFADMLEVLFQFAPVTYLNGIDYKTLILFGYAGKHPKVNGTYVNFFCSWARFSIFKSRNLLMYHGKSVRALALFKHYCKTSIKQRLFYCIEKGLRSKFEREFIFLNPIVCFNHDDRLHIRL